MKNINNRQNKNKNYMMVLKKLFRFINSNCNYQLCNLNKQMKKKKHNQLKVQFLKISRLSIKLNTFKLKKNF